MRSTLRRVLSYPVLRSLLLCLLVLMFYSVSAAQDEPQPTDEPTATPTEIPTEIPPTELPTDLPPTEVPTDIPPTEIPTEVATQEPTLEPTQAVSVPPVFDLGGLASLATTSGIPLTFQVRVADETGVVRVTADTSGTSGAVSLNQTDPVETSVPYITVVTVTYLPAAGFSGTDSFTLTAIDQVGVAVSVSLQISVTALVATLEATPLSTVTPTQTLIINYNPAASEAAIQNMLAALGAVEVSRIPQIGAMKVLVPDAVSDPGTALITVNGNAAALAAGVTNIEPIIEYHIDYIPNDPRYLSGTQTGLNGFYGIYAATAWDLAPTRGTGVNVAVLDTGIDKDHPEFIGRLGVGWDFVNDDNNPDDDHYHGTHVAGVIGAKTNNGVGMAGIAFNAKLIPVKVCNLFGSCPVYEIAAGIIYAVDNNAQIINMSLGGSQVSSTIEGAVAYAISRNVTVVAAAGNTGLGGYNYPASYPGVISVAAHDPVTGAIASFSTFNDRVTISAPGVSINSTVPVEQGSYGDLDGTSMAAPHVAGIAALLWAQNVARTPATIKEALICSAYDLGAPGRDDNYGWGIVQADWAMNWYYNSPGCKVTQPNDNFQNATPITTTTFSKIQAIHSRSVTSQATDPSFCGPPSQTLWYSFKAPASTVYQINTTGSSYDTTLSVYQGVQGDLRGLSCSDDNFGSPQSSLTLSTQAGQIYYIMVDGFDTFFFDDEILQLNINPALLTNNVDTQQNAVNFAYSGTWATTTITGASGGTVAQTSDNNAIASFTFQGIGFSYARTVGPDRGALDVWIDDLFVTTISNRAALVKANQLVDIFVPGGAAGGVHRVQLRRSPFGPPGSVDLDRIRTIESAVVPTLAVTTISDDRVITKFKFTSGSWLLVSVPGSYLNTVTQTTDTGAVVTFRATGSTITVFRSTNPGYGTMDVYVDGAFYATVANNNGTGQKVPYVIAGLSPNTHVIQVVNTVGSTLQFDGAQASSPVALAASTLQTNENSPSLIYNGLWTNLTPALAFGRTSRVSFTSSDSVHFNFTGNWFCFSYAQRPDGGLVDVYVDDLYQGFVDTFGSTSYGWIACSSLLAEGTHRVELVQISAFTAFELDSVWARRQTVLTPSMGVVQESNAAITYQTAYGPWYNTVAGSLGGYKFQGGAAKWTNSNGGRLYFYINGTGFILYTSVGPLNGDWEVYVDGVLWNVLVSGASYPYIDLNNFRFRPMGYGITNLSPGQHHIELRAINIGPGGFVDFDGVRVFP